MPRIRTGQPLSPAERVRRHRARRRAAGLRAVTRWRSSTPAWSDHRVAEARSLAFHVLAARRIAANPSLLKRARSTVARWLERYGERPPAALREWQELQRTISRSLGDLRERIEGRQLSRPTLSQRPHLPSLPQLRRPNVNRADLEAFAGRLVCVLVWSLLAATGAAAEPPPRKHSNLERLALERLGRVDVHEAS